MTVLLKLTFQNGTRAGETLEVTQFDICLGRNPNCDIVLRDDTVSGRHARMKLHSNRWFVADLGSRNGTILQEEELAPKNWVPLPEFGRLTFGEVAVLFDSRRMESVWSSGESEAPSNPKTEFDVPKVARPPTRALDTGLTSGQGTEKLGPTLEVFSGESSDPVVSRLEEQIEVLRRQKSDLEDRVRELEEERDQAVARAEEAMRSLASSGPVALPASDGVSDDDSDQRGRLFDALGKVMADLNEAAKRATEAYPDSTEMTDVVRLSRGCIVRLRDLASFLGL